MTRTKWYPIGIAGTGNLTGARVQALIKRSLAFMLEYELANLDQCFDADTSDCVRHIGYTPERDLVTVETAIAEYQKAVRCLQPVVW